MSQLQSFNAESRCPKCGHDAVKSWYCEGNRRPCTKWHVTSYGWGTSLVGEDQEHIHRKCEHYHYEWPQDAIRLGEPEPRPVAASEERK